MRRADPRLLELAGPPIEGRTAPERAANQPADGLSLVPLFEGGGTPDARWSRDAIYWHFPGYLGAGANGWRTTPASALRAGDWKLVEFDEDGRLELYNLKEDLGETRNLAEERPELTGELKAKLDAWRTSVGAKRPTRRDPRAEAEPEPKPEPQPEAAPKKAAGAARKKADAPGKAARPGATPKKKAAPEPRPPGISSN